MPSRKGRAIVGLAAAFVALVGFANGPLPAASNVCAPPPCRPDSVGTIVGRVRVPAAAAAAGPPRLSPYSRQRYSAPAPRASTVDVQNVVVYVATAPAGASAAPRTMTVTQRDLRITPHVTALPAGSVVDFPNDDDVFHNLFSLSSTKRFNLGRYPPGDSRSVTFDRPGIVRMFCDIHSDMGGVIYVLEHGVFARPAADGSFSIEGVPAGEHTVVAWHQALPSDSISVVVGTGVVRADLALGR